jgi:glyoxylase-like metal-dependent hydrolase (beta-lactamase superfamily II)
MTAAGAGVSDVDGAHRGQRIRGSRGLLRSGAQMAATPIVSTRLMNIMTMLAGPGGNVIVQHGLDGKVVVDTFVQGAFAGLKQRMDAMGTVPILFAIDTHWHFDHADNNENFRNGGATVIAHANTSKRLSEPRASRRRISTRRGAKGSCRPTRS